MTTLDELFPGTRRRLAFFEQVRAHLDGVQAVLEAPSSTAALTELIRRTVKLQAWAARVPDTAATADALAVVARELSALAAAADTDAAERSAIIARLRTAGARAADTARADRRAAVACYLVLLSAWKRLRRRAGRALTTSTRPGVRRCPRTPRAPGRVPAARHP